MSLSIKNVVVDRIANANSLSPIAVFKTNKKSKCDNELFDAVFADTIITRNIIAETHGEYLMGVFHGNEGVREFKAII